VPEPIRLVIACDTFAPDINGAARFAERLAAGLARRGHEVHVIAPSTTARAQSGIEVIDGAEMTVHRMPSWKLPQHKTLRYVHPFGLKRRIEQILKDVDPVALHINSHILIGRFALRAARNLPTLRRIATNHIMPENLMRYSFVPGPLQPAAMRVLWKDAGRVLRRVDVVTTPTRRAANLLEAAADLTGTLAISCGINAARFANDTPTSNRPPRFLYLGRLDAEKRADVLLRAVAALADHPEIEVELVGDGGERERLHRLAVDLGIARQVQFTGHISEQELPAAYERATAFVMPSIAELQSIATMEAMASGRPVIGADAMALPHLVHDGDNGYLFPADDYHALADRLLRIVQADAAELKRLSENSLHLISAHDINRTLDIFEDLYLGVGAEAPTSNDNEPGYLEPIGRLAEGVRHRLAHWQDNALRLRRRADELRELAVERFTEAAEDARGRIGEAAHDAKEHLDEFREDIAAAGKRLRKRLRDD
jgi:glycosyltransferase involved in cell wall biosynthesis